MKLHVVFVVAGSEYALPFDLILQMESFSGATSVPGTPEYVLGVVTVRGRVVPVVDLRLRFGKPALMDTPDTRIAVTQLGGRVVAVDLDAGQVPALALPVHLHRDRRARGERRGEQLLRARADVLAADVLGLVRDEAVLAHTDLVLVLALADGDRAHWRHDSTPRPGC